MKKAKLLGVILLSGIILMGCSNTDSKPKSSTADQEVVGKVTYQVDSKHKKDSFAYQNDERQAKKSAIEEQAPDEYLDFITLLNIVENYYPTEPYYLSQKDSLPEEKEQEINMLKTNISQAKEYQKEIDAIKKTMNNAEEYEDAKSRITLAKSFEHYLVTYDAGYSSEETTSSSTAPKTETKESVEKQLPKPKKEAPKKEAPKKEPSNKSSEYTKELQDLSDLYDSVTLKLENFSKNPETYTLINFMEVQNEMNLIIVELSDITDVFNSNDVTEKEALELYQKVMEKQTKMLTAATTLPEDFAK